MNVGEPQREIIVEPLEDPVPGREEPAVEPEPDRQEEEVPA